MDENLHRKIRSGEKVTVKKGLTGRESGDKEIKNNIKFGLD